MGVGVKQGSPALCRVLMTNTWFAYLIYQDLKVFCQLVMCVPPFRPSLLLTPQALESRYSGLEQALLLAWCTHVQKGTSRDELQAWQMAPYVEAVMAQPRSCFMLQVGLDMSSGVWRSGWSPSDRI